jgi:hypothetical protein
MRNAKIINWHLIRTGTGAVIRIVLFLKSLTFLAGKSAEGGITNKASPSKAKYYF